MKETLRKIQVDYRINIQIITRFYFYLYTVLYILKKKNTKHINNSTRHDHEIQKIL